MTMLWKNREHGLMSRESKSIGVQTPVIELKFHATVGKDDEVDIVLITSKMMKKMKK